MNFVHPAGGDCWTRSPCMNMLDHFSPDPLVNPKLQEAERLSDRPDQSSPVPVTEMEIPDGGITDTTSHPPTEENIDPTEWFPHYQACLQHFLNQGQHSVPVLSLAAFINIRLPFQRHDPVWQYAPQPTQSGTSFISLRPYLRRLIVTGHDTPTVLHAFFGDDWVTGVGCICKQERVNYLFTAKSSGWASTKAAYDILPDEETPFLRPLREPGEMELRAAEAKWSEWLAMEDWMVGPRSPW